jgi:hypothetical protein
MEFFGLLMEWAGEPVAISSFVRLMKAEADLFTDSDRPAFDVNRA